MGKLGIREYLRPYHGQMNHPNRSLSSGANTLPHCCAHSNATADRGQRCRYLRSALSAQAEPDQEFKRLITTEGMIIERQQRLGTRIK